jgi:hypothetical protein
MDQGDAEQNGVTDFDLVGQRAAGESLAAGGPEDGSHRVPEATRAKARHSGLSAASAGPFLVKLNHELARELERYAASQNMTPETIIAEAVRTYLGVDE